MVLWIDERTSRKHVFIPHERPLYGVVALLQELGYGTTGFVLAEGGFSDFDNPYQEMHIYADGQTTPLATLSEFGDELISSVSLRYNEPLDSASGERQQPATSDVWMGIVQLLASAVRGSTRWKNFQTVEARAWTTQPHTDEEGFRDESSVEFHQDYDIWATPRYDWQVSWMAHGSFGEQDVDGYAYEVMRDYRAVATFAANRPVRLARVHLVTYAGSKFADVVSLDLFPEYHNLSTEPTADHPVWRQYCRPLRSHEDDEVDLIDPPVYMTHWEALEHGMWPHIVQPWSVYQPEA